MLRVPCPQGGAHLWSKRIGAGSLIPAAGYNMALDSSGDLLLAARFLGELDLREVGGPVLRRGSPHGDAFVAKLDAFGTLRAVTRVLDTDAGWPSLSVAADRAGAGYLVGAASSELGAARIDASLTSTWQHTLCDHVSITLDKDVFGVATDVHGNALITGVGANTTAVEATGVLRYVFLLKVDPSGHVVRRCRFACTGRAFGPQIAVDRRGHTLLWGSFNGVLHFDHGVLHSAARGVDLYLAKLDGKGALFWCQRVPTGLGQGLAAALGPAGEVFLCGLGAPRAEPSLEGFRQEPTASLVLAKLDADGHPVFVRQYLTDTPDASAPSIAVDGQGAVLLASHGRRPIDLEKRPSVGGERECTSLFVAKVDGAKGGLRWSRRFKGAADLYGLSVKGCSDGSMRLAGFLSGELDLGGGLLRSHPKRPELIVVKLGP